VGDLGASVATDGANEDEDAIGCEEEDSVVNPFRKRRRRGFLKDRKLGLWLRLLWESSSSSPGTIKQLLSAAEAHCVTGLWKVALADVCRRLGRSRAPRPYEALPVYGGGTVVFKLGEIYHNSNRSSSSDNCEFRA
jgi:hypothetical protein